MERTKQGRGRPRGVRFPRKLPVYDTEEGMALLCELAHLRGISAAAVARQLVREEARRVGLAAALTPEPKPGGTAPNEEAQGGAS